MKIVRLFVRPTENGLTLQDFLAARLRLSRNKAKARIDARKVLVNGNLVWIARHVLNAGDCVETTEPERSPANRAFDLPIVFQDAEYVVANKPPGLLANGPHSAEELLRAATGIGTLRAVHRLDRDTTGCLLLAKQSRAFEAAVSVFKKRLVRKTYHAIVAGAVYPPVRTITYPLEGQPAITKVRTADASREASHVIIKIETGRTHQIRKHLARIHHPVLGDRIYGQHTALSAADLAVPRHMLHASEIALVNPITRQAIRASAPLPEDFRRCLRRLGLK